MKAQMRERLGFPKSFDRIPLNLYSGKFSSEIISQLRLSMLTSKNIMDFNPPVASNPTSHFQQYEKFDAPFDPANEQFAFEFLTKTLEDSLSKLKSRDFYLNRIGEIEGNIDTIDRYHTLNASRLQLDEHDIIKANLEFLCKSRDSNIRNLYKK